MSRARLEEELGGGPLPDELSLLADDELAALAEHIAAARRRQTAELDAAGEQALNHIPKLLRGAVRKAIGL